MTIVLEESNTEKQCSVVRSFLWANELNLKDIHEEIFPVRGASPSTERSRSIM
jgi:hypothetical protein